MVGNLVLSLPLSKTGQRTVKMRDSNIVYFFFVYGVCFISPAEKFQTKKSIRNSDTIT